MKKLLVAAIAVFTFSAVSAQEDGGFAKGDLFVSGAVSFGSINNKNSDEKESEFVVEPKIGYFLSDNIAIGAKVGFGSSKFEAANTTLSEDTDFTVGVFGRYYFTPASKFSLFAELGLDYMTSEDISNTKVNTIGAGLNLGLNYFVSKNFAIEAYAAALGFASSKADVAGAETVSGFGFGGDWRNGSVGIGVLYKF